MRMFTIHNGRTAPTYPNQHLKYMRGDQESEKLPNPSLIKDIATFLKTQWSYLAHSKAFQKQQMTEEKSMSSQQT